jgi:hypothetical protein
VRRVEKGEKGGEGRRVEKGGEERLECKSVKDEKREKGVTMVNGRTMKRWKTKG